MKKHLNKTLKTLVCKAISPMGGGAGRNMCIKRYAGYKNFLTLVLSLFFTLSPVYAAGASADSAELLVPTLDSLAGKPIAGSNPQEFYPDNLKSAYFLTETSGTGENIITKYIINEDGTAAAQNYLISFRNNDFGTGDGKKYFKWDTTDGAKLVSTDAAGAQITVNYDTANSHAYTEITSDSSASSIQGGSFIGLYKNAAKVYGGAFNVGANAAYGNITADFIDNYVSGTSSGSNTQGGAVYVNSNGYIASINGNFVGNYAVTGSAAYSYAYGGAIYSIGTIDSINGNFINNYVSSAANSSGVEGGAIRIGGTIKNLSANFIGNYASAPSGKAYGGAIYNTYGTVENLVGGFVNNYVYSNGSSSLTTGGGAIYNYHGTFEKIAADFVGNYAVAKDGYAQGGAIHNNMGTFANISGDFIRNYAKTKTANAQGGAVYNAGAINSITGDFIENKLSISNGSSYVSASGGAIYNNLGTYKMSYADKGIIDTITADFINNSIETTGYGYGGAIYNAGIIKNINGNFAGNYISASSARGGAIYNEGTIEKITGAFIENTATGSPRGGAIHNASKIIDIDASFTGNYLSGEGGAIYNSGTITNLSGDFIANHSDGDYGGAIYNDGGTITSISGNFRENYASDSGGNAYGGAIYNYDGEITSIKGDFTQNYVLTQDDDKSFGGAIYNSATIGSIEADFNGNSAVCLDDDNANGGAIYNEAMITTIKGNFAGNYVSSVDDDAFGGAIYNSGEITDISGTFTENYAVVEGEDANGGAIHNTNTITNINGVFKGNYAFSEEEDGSGGAIFNDGTISGYLKGSFEGNHATKGGAVYNIDTINSITADFVDNFCYDADETVKGGAIYHHGTIGYLQGNFEENYISSDSGTAYGGAIFINYGSEINIVNSNFINNHASSNNQAFGGAIHSDCSDVTIVADAGTSLFSGNYTSVNGKIVQNAIYMLCEAPTYPDQVIDERYTLTLEAKNNGVIRFDDQIAGGAFKLTLTQFPDGGIMVSGDRIYIDDPEYAFTLALTGDGTGTISLYNDVINANVTAENVTVDFANNAPLDYEFVSLSSQNSAKYNIDVDLSTGKADTITTEKNSSGIVTLNIINFIGSAEGHKTFQILHTQDSNLQLALGENIHIAENILETLTDTVYNTDIFAQEGGINLTTTSTTNDSIIVYKDKIYDTLNIITAKNSANPRNFIFNSADNYILSQNLETATAGTLNISGINNNISTINANNHSMFELANKTTLNISNTTIKNASSATNGSVINASNPDSEINISNSSFVNNSSDGVGGAIYSKTNIQISASNSSSNFSSNTANGESNAIYLDATDKTLTLNATNNGSINFDDQINGQDGYKIALNGDSTGKISLNNSVNKANVTMDNITLSMKEDTFKNADVTMNSGTLALQNNIAETYSFNTLNLNGNISLSPDVDLENEKMDRLQAQNYTSTQNASINIPSLNLISQSNKESLSILFADPEIAGKVNYTGSSTAYTPIYVYNVGYDASNGSFTFQRGENNPAVLPAPVTMQAGAFTQQTQTVHYAFQHAETFMNIPYLERISMINANKYALSPTGDATDVGNFSPIFTKTEDEAFWVKPYSSFESIPLKNGPKVSNINYGTLIGHDSKLETVKYGFERVLTAYIGYNGASQRYQGIDTYQNGGLLGGTATFYKGNFFNATTATVGSTVGSTSSMYGHENYTMLIAGIANKAGYNFEFAKGKFIVQPSLLLSYTFVNTFDFTNAAGLRIKSDPLNAIQIAPGIKFIGNTKSGWQPYLAVNMVWNILDESKVTANDTRLPEMSIDPYVEYGVGVQKRWAESYTAYIQAMIHSGGRNGVSLTGGLRWKVGKKK